MSGGKRSAPVTARAGNMPVWARWHSLDAVRGWAILAMLLDHACLVFGGPGEVRMTAGRAAMPLFFILAGFLAAGADRKVTLRHRHLWVALTGLCLPVFVPWIDTPNVLLLWAAGVAILAGWQAARLPYWVLAAVGLTFGANHFDTSPAGFEPAALVGLMALGALLPYTAFDWAAKSPKWVGWIGRYPVRIYVGHLLLLQLYIQFR